MEKDTETKLLGHAQVNLVEQIFRLIEGNEGRVETESDWKAVALLFELYKLDRPEEYREFLERMKENRLATSHNNAIVKDDSGDMVQHALEIPARFNQYLSVVFPKIDYTMKFCQRLARELPILKMTDNL